MEINLNFKFLSHKWKISVSKQWVQFAVFIITILAAVIVSYWGSTRMLSLIPLMLGGIAFILILFNKINIGFIVILLSGMFIPFSGPGGINATVLMVAALLALWFLDMLVVKRSFYFVRSRVLLPAVIFLVISVIAFGMGQLSWFQFANQAPLDAQLGGFTIFILSVGLMLGTMNMIQDMKWLEIIVWVFLGFGAVYIIGRLLNLPVTDFYQQGYRAGSMFWTWSVALMFSQLVFNNKLRRSFKSLLLVMLVITFYVAMIQAYRWKSGWVPPLVAVAVILALRYPRLLIFSIPVAIIVAGYLAIDLIASDVYSWDTRLEAWAIVLKISQVNPLLGLGFANYYWYTPLFPIRGWYVNFNSHSQYVDLIAQVGVLGLICYFWIFFEVGRLSFKLAKKLPDGFGRAYAHGVFAGVIATIVAGFLVDWILPFVYNIGFNGFRASILPWIFCGALVSIEQIYKRTIENKFE